MHTKSFILGMLFFSYVAFAQDLYLYVEEFPEKIYKNQIFPITLKLIKTDIDFDEINTTLTSKHITVHNRDEKWKWYNENTYYNTYYLQASKRASALPFLEVSLLVHNSLEENNINGIVSVLAELNLSTPQETIEPSTQDAFSLLKTIDMPSATQRQIVAQTSLQLPEISYLPIKWGKNYSSLVAKELKIINFENKEYDKEHNIIAMEIETTLANVNDFSIQNSDIMEQGINQILSNPPYSNLIYYAIVDNKLKNFEFNYFNTQKSQFEYISLPIFVKLDTISTQTDISPKKSNIHIWRLSALAGAALILFAFFLYRKKYLYLLSAIIVLGIAGYLMLPKEEIAIMEGAKIRILPIDKSTTFHILHSPMTTEALQQTNSFTKIIYNNKVGWVHEQFIKTD